MKKELKIISQINFILSGFKKKFLILTILIGINSFLEILSIGIFIPALNLFIKNTNVSILSEFSFNQSLIIFFLLIIFVFIFKFFLFLYLLIFQNKFLRDLNLWYNKKLLFLLLQKPISYFLNKNSSENINLVKNVDAINIVLSHFIMIVIDIITTTLIIIFMLIYEPLVTLIIILVLLITVSGYYLYSKNLLLNIGKIKFQSSEKILNNLREIFNGIKEVKIYRAYNYFTNNFLNNQKNYIEAANKETIIVSLPRLFLEILMIIFFGTIILLFLSYNYSLEEIVIKLGIFILVSLKILPTVNRLLYNFQSIKTHKFSFNRVYDAITSNEFKNEILKINENINFKNKIELFNVHFKYPGTKKNIFEKLNFTIRKGETIGIFGESGSGKSTFVDLLCGFYKPTSGLILLDDEKEKIYSNNWLDKISYIPQKIFLSDNSIKFNIAYGQKDNENDINKIDFILSSKELVKFIRDFPEREHTRIGEDGLKISGGQRQRIGVARALYKSSEIIILDEATSAIDMASEKQLIDFLFDYLRGKTIIVISHRKETLARCDKIYQLIDKTFKPI